MSLGLYYWSDVLRAEWSCPYSSMGLRVHSETCEGLSWGEIFALSEMWGHMEMIREFFMALGHEKLGSYELIDCESLLSHRRTGRLGAGEVLTRHFRSIADAMGSGDLGNVAWILGNENPADGLTQATSDRGPLFHLLDTGMYRPGRLGQLRGVSFLEKL